MRNSRNRSDSNGSSKFISFSPSRTCLQLERSGKEVVGGNDGLFQRLGALGIG